MIQGRWTCRRPPAQPPRDDIGPRLSHPQAPNACGHQQIWGCGPFHYKPRIQDAAAPRKSPTFCELPDSSDAQNVHRLREGCRGRALPDVVQRGGGPAGDGPMISSTSMKARRSAGGKKGDLARRNRSVARRPNNQGPHAGGRGGRPRVVHLSPGQASDIIAANTLWTK